MSLPTFLICVICYMGHSPGLMLAVCLLSCLCSD
jgi:hypothetical protein